MGCQLVSHVERENLEHAVEYVLAPEEAVPKL